MLFTTIREEPFQFWFNIPIAIIHSASLVLITVANMKLFDLTIKFTKENLIYCEIISAVIFLALANILNLLANGIHNYLYSVRTIKLKGDLEELVHKKISNIECINFENAIFLDKLEKAKKGIETGIFASDLFITIISFYIPYFIFMTLLLKNIHKSLVLVALFIFAPIILGQYIRSKLYSKQEDELSQLRRKIAQRENEIYSVKYFKETRHLKAADFLIKTYQDIIKTYNSLRWKTEKKSLYILWLSNIITALGFFAVLFILFYLLVKDQVSAGTLAALVMSLNTMFGTAEEVVNVHIGNIAENIVGVKNLVEFLELDECINNYGGLEIDWTKGVELKDVFFKYPNCENYVLRDINMKIKHGDTIAIVGANGSGKTTLLNIISGIFTPTHGELYLAGVNRRECGGSVAFKRESVILQNYQRYKMTAKENVTISDQEKDFNFSEYNDIMNAVDFEKEFDEAVILSKEFGGIDISGGQWQKLAIARGLYRNSSILLCDEPTSSIDPMEEDKVYNVFKDISNCKTTIIISHRLASVKFVSKIIVMDNGQIVEQGSHDELMRKEGVYAKLYKTQSDWYRSEYDDSLYCP